MGPGTRDSGPRTHTWDPALGTLHLGAFTRDPGPQIHRRDPGPGNFTWDPGPGTLHQGPFTWDSGLETLYEGPYIESGPNTLRRTWETYININLETLTLIQLSLNVRFSSVT